MTLEAQQDRRNRLLVDFYTHILMRNKKKLSKNKK